MEPTIQSEPFTALRDSRPGVDEKLIGSSVAFASVLSRVAQVAPSEDTVLLYGETGTGKSLVAHLIHARSRRRGRRFLSLNCGALSTNVIEHELFGRERCAFTNAPFSQPGRFERANGGTLFLDEVGELPLETQPKLLRVLQHRELERIGSSHTVAVDVRVVGATSRNIRDAVGSARFRKDLYRQLNVCPILLPALRDRREDIPELVTHFVEHLAVRYGKSPARVSPELMRKLRAYHWPGNIRELENVIERAVISSSDGVLTIADSFDDAHLFNRCDNDEPVRMNFIDVERRHIVHVLRAKRWCIEGPFGAAAVLGLNPSTLRSRLRKLGITRPAAFH
jgi:formate hydrogenlyase transcriptional activator